ncbi:hypothetical protein EYB45_09955 [Erythrobacteraceae bacterium CFH 75059]|uniref:hypothetical protein n=1 Tax=Qipengyuania thermophila TaxID=2509361 RepID=UPI00101EB655|nr:hypothetical protein [Qipengyuania thermophila]TCD02285.1 hypothetical protein EYB45_09955 [Erythrobacteraceae bacterium CFH 75059]
MTMRTIVFCCTLLAAALAGGCANRTMLEPAPGASLPATAYGADSVSDADRLLQVPVQAVPTRSQELRTRSERRDDDPFDLPPP